MGSLGSAGCCCSTPSQCYCGTLCSDVCGDRSGSPAATACISQPEWDRNYASLPGTGSGACVSIAGYLYFFDLTLSDCVDPVSPDSIQWESSFLADECPNPDCPDIEITWSGNVTYVTTCCDVGDGGGGSLWEWDYAGTLSQGAETVSATGAELCSTVSKLTTMEYVPNTSACGTPYNFVASSDGGARVRFILSRDVVDDYWVLEVNSSGVLPGFIANEASGTGWFLRFTNGPLTDCPPQEGWIFDSEGSTLPILNDHSCPTGPHQYISSFSEGGVTIAYV